MPFDTFYNYLFSTFKNTVKTVLFVLTCIFLLYAISCIFSMVHIKEDDLNLLMYLGAGFVITLFVVPFYATNINCGSLLVALLISQVAGIIGAHYFPNCAPLWIVTFLGVMLNFNVYLTYTVPHIFHIDSLINFGLFKTHLSAATALVGSLAQTVVAIYILQEQPYLLVLAFFSTCLIALNIQAYLEKSVLLGPTIFHNYYYLYLNSIKGTCCARSLFIRCILIIFALVGFNPLIALAMPLDFFNLELGAAPSLIIDSEALGESSLAARRSGSLLRRSLDALPTNSGAASPSMGQRIAEGGVGSTVSAIICGAASHQQTGLTTEEDPVFDLPLNLNVPEQDTVQEQPISEEVVAPAIENQLSLSQKVSRRLSTFGASLKRHFSCFGS